MGQNKMKHETVRVPPRQSAARPSLRYSPANGARQAGGEGKKGGKSGTYTGGKEVIGQRLRLIRVSVAITGRKRSLNTPMRHEAAHTFRPPLGCACSRGKTRTGNRPRRGRRRLSCVTCAANRTVWSSPRFPRTPPATPGTEGVHPALEPTKISPQCRREHSVPLPHGRAPQDGGFGKTASRCRRTLCAAIAVSQKR